MSEGGKGFVLGLLGATVVAALIMLFGGFLSYVALVSAPAKLPPKVDAIVVLTGGDSRLQEGMSLLADGHGSRLLLSGVNDEIDRAEIRKLIEPAHLAMFDCCVDLDKSALNTIGNAVETGAWARSQGYKQIIVVTAHYHMPRALAELSHEAPDLKLHPWPVAPTGVHLDDWWRWPGSAKLLSAEYLKFLATQLRFRLERL